MHLWQATWSAESSFLLWAEKSGRAAADDGSAPPGGPHPFCCTTEELIADLATVEREADGEEELTIYLPSDQLGPLPSPRLPHLDSERAIEPELLPWRVAAVRLSPIEAVNLLTELSEQPPQGIRFDRSLLFWREATKLLLELLTRGRFLPSLQRENGRWAARWQIRGTDFNDYARLDVLAESMPPLCRAVCPLDRSRTNDPAELLESFIAVCGDSLIRSFLRRHSLVPEENGRPQSRRTTYLDWLRALTSDDPFVEGSEYELGSFESQLRSWSSTRVPAIRTPQFNTAFILEPPPTGDMGQTWKVHFALRSFQEPSRELSAAELWSGELGFLKDAQLSMSELEERLLRDLGRALPFFPELRQALSESHPTHCILTTEQAYRFLKETSRVLDDQGYTVVLPDWWKEPSVRLGLTMRVDSEELAPGNRQGFLPASELLQYSWEISLGDERLSIDDFRGMVSAHSPLLRVNDQWIELNPKQVDHTLRFLEEQKSSEMRFLDVLKLGLGIQHDPQMLPVTGISATGWIRRLLDAEHHSVPRLTEPPEFEGSLRPYQRDGLSWLAFLTTLGVGGCLADDMGLGKTIQLLALLLHERDQAQGRRVNPCLLVVPMSILANWEEEATRFAPTLRYYMHHGPNRLSGERFFEAVREADLVITTYSLVHRDEKLLSAVEWGRLALDEAQNIKNVETKQTKAVRRLARACMLRDGSSAPCHRLALTGTPLENHLDELWSIFDFLNPGFLGTLHEFRTRFILPIERYRNRESASMLSRLIQPFLLRRLKTDPKIISDLPPKMEMPVYTPLTQEQAALYQAVVEDMLPQVARAEGMHRKGLVLATITKLKQICNHPSLFLKDGRPLAGRSGKLERLEEILEVVLSEGDRVLIFTQYAQMGHLLKPYLQERFDAEVLFLHGALSRKARDSVIEQFRKEDGPPIFILSLKAGGFGLNLTEANQVIHLDQWWNPAVEEQATDRAYRIGQKRSVQVRKFLCKGTLEERINAMLAHKRDLAEQVVGSNKNMVTQLSLDELRNLLQLSEGAA